jgi:hypothetical protein
VDDVDADLITLFNFANFGNKPSRLTTSQRDGLVNLYHGLVIFNINTDSLNVYTSQGWIDLQNQPSPHCSLTDSTTQVSAGLTSENLVTWDTDEIKFRITHSTVTDTSRIYLDEDGTYRITFNASPEPSASNKTARFWLKVDGVNVPRTGTKVAIPNSAAEGLFSITYIYQFSQGQYFEIAWASVDNADMQLTATAADINPTRPASPSVFLNVTRISN